MQITGTQNIAVPRQRVWDALNDTDILRKCLPGCESIERTSQDSCKVVMAAAIGPLRARFHGVLRMTDAIAPQSCTMQFEGQGGAVGFGKGSSGVTLTESDGQTTVTYTAEAQVGGKLAQVGSRLIDSVARKMADDFFKAFQGQLLPKQVAIPSQAVLTPAADVSAHPSTVSQSHPSVSEIAPELERKGTAAVVMVPGWWLGVAAILGSAATLAGLFFSH